jgi:hypothetical protein
MSRRDAVARTYAEPTYTEPSRTRPARWIVLALVAWELSQMAIGVYYGVRVALAVT